MKISIIIAFNTPYISLDSQTAVGEDYLQFMEDLTKLMKDGTSFIIETNKGSILIAKRKKRTAFDTLSIFNQIIEALSEDKASLEKEANVHGRTMEHECSLTDGTMPIGYEFRPLPKY